MLDANGFITLPEYGSIQPQFLAVVNEVVDVLVQRQKSLIHSIYLYGRIARGNAIEEISDLDICIVLTRASSEDENRMFAEVQRDSARHHPVVSKIDVDNGVLSEVISPTNLYSWGYWLKYHCRCVYGEDLSIL